MALSEKEALERYENLKKDIMRTTPVPRRESPSAKEKRIKGLLSDFDAFCKYYFPVYFDPQHKGSEFGWFHHKAAEEVINNRDIFLVAEWPREHAKSVFFDIMMPLYLKAKGELEGFVLCSQSSDKAKGLLGDIQAQLEANHRYINDFGEQKSFGNWTEAHFVTRDGIGFWSIGKGQSPRGIREAEKRPNCLVVDDFDDDKEVENEELVKKSHIWLMGAMIGAMSLLQSRFMMVGNRIAKKSVLAKVVGDVEDDDPKNPEITHIKVFALENPDTKEEDQSETGVPAWKERYQRQHIIRRIRIMGYAVSQREFFHRHIKEGTKFKEEWIQYIMLPDIKYFDGVVTYCDPSFKDSKKNDFKAIVALGKIGSKRYLIDCWVRQASRYSMASAHYDMHYDVEAQAPRILESYIEANFTQDQLIDDYIQYSDEVGHMMPIREDLRSKPNKQGRIENLITLFERGLIYISELLRNKHDWQVLKSQFIAFPNDHDDGPDAVEGAEYKLKNIGRATKPPQGGPHERQKDF